MILALVPVRCNELAKLIAVTCAKTLREKLRRWIVNKNLSKFDVLGVPINFPSPESKVVYYFAMWVVYKE